MINLYYKSDDMTNSKTKTIGVRLDPVQEFICDELAAKLAVSPPEVLRLALIEFAKWQGQPTDRATIVERIKKENLLNQ